MRRLNFCIAFALSTSFFVSICSAQQTLSKSPSNSERQGSPTPPPGPIIGGDGTKNYIPIWATRRYLISSVIYQASGGNVGIGTTTPAAALDVNGGINAAMTYQIGGNNVVNIGSPTDQNLFLGVEAGQNNAAGQGANNTFAGYRAGYSNTEGFSNSFYGDEAGYSNTYGSGNTFVGNMAGYNNISGRFNTFVSVQAGYSNIDGSYNAFHGYQAGYSNTRGNRNTFSGFQAGYGNTKGDKNVFVGNMAGYSNTTGENNTFVGNMAGDDNTTGSVNTFVGSGAGISNTTGIHDIYIGNQGPPSGDESLTIRIGSPGVQLTAYIAGIYDSTSSSGVPVYVNSDGQLGTLTSSLRFKEQVRDMGDSTDALMKLRPVTFFYTPEYGNGERTLQYGLIAEEVAKVYPELVAYDKGGQPYTVRYQYLSTMLLNEVQKQYRRAEAAAKVITTQEQKIDSQQKQIEDLQQRLSRLESLVDSKVRTAQENPPNAGTPGGVQ